MTRLFVAAIADGRPGRGTFRNIIGCREKRILLPRRSCGALQADGFVDAHVGVLARLGILLTIACVFGIGATLTGVLFLVDEYF